MGRPSINEADPSDAVKLYLRHVPIDDGYDPNGTYFGHGEPLYWYANAAGTIDDVTRARDRGHAKKLIRKEYPKATFFN